MISRKLSLLALLSLIIALLTVLDVMTESASAAGSPSVLHTRHAVTSGHRGNEMTTHVRVHLSANR